jgi:tetratricopeptide (TPR) repeat protein
MLKWIVPVLLLAIASGCASSLQANKGNQALEKGDLDQAILYYNEHLRRYPDDSAARNNLAVAFLRQKKYEEAFNELQKVIAQKPGDPSAHYNLALVYYYKRLFKEEIGEYRKTIELAPHHFGAHVNLGHALLAAGDKRGAAEQYAWVVERTPQDRTIYYTLGMLRKELNEPAKARDMFRKYLELEPDGKFSREARQSLSELEKDLPKP